MTPSQTSPPSEHRPRLCLGDGAAADIGWGGKAPSKVPANVRRGDDSAAAAASPPAHPPEEAKPVRVALSGEMAPEPRLGGRFVVRGRWSYEDDGPSDPDAAATAAAEEEETAARRTFELVQAPRRKLPRAVGGEPAPLALAATGTYRGSFALPAAAGEVKNDQSVRESNVRLEFRRAEGEGGDGRRGAYEVTGGGSNRFGRFLLRGGCFPAAGDGDADGAEAAASSSFRVELRKEYLPPTPPSAPRSPSPPRLRTPAERKRKEAFKPDEGDGTAKKKKGKKRRKGRKSPAKKSAREEKGEQGEPVSREEFDALVEMAKDIAERMAAMRSLLAGKAREEVAVPSAAEFQPCAAQAKKEDETPAVDLKNPCSAKHPRPPPKAPSGKRRRAVCPPTPDLVKERREGPLTVREQLDLVQALNHADASTVQSAARIIREARRGAGGGADNDGGDDDGEIQLDLDQLDVATQRQLQKLTMQSPAGGNTPASKEPDGRATAQEAKQADQKAALSSFMRFDKEASASGSDEEDCNSAGGGEFDLDLTKDRAASNDRTQDCGLIDWSSLGAFAADVAAAGASRRREGDGGRGDVAAAPDGSAGWDAARRHAEELRSRRADRAGRVRRAEEGFQCARERRAAESLARGREAKSRREEEEAAGAARREEEAERRRGEMRDEVKRRIESVRPTVDLDPSAPSDVRHPDALDGLLSAELSISACSTPSNYGF